jgi:hypothetical protein
LLDVTFLYLYYGGMLILFLVSLLGELSWSFASKSALWLFVTVRLYKIKTQTFACFFFCF